MTKKTIPFAAPLALAVGAVLSTPAAAATWNPGAMRSEISQLDRQIDRAQRTGNLTRTEAARLRAQVDSLQSLYSRYARGGFNRGEIAALNQRIDAVQHRLALNANDRDHRGSERREERRDDRQDDRRDDRQDSRRDDRH